MEKPGCSCPVGTVVVISTFRLSVVCGVREEGGDCRQIVVTLSQKSAALHNTRKYNVEFCEHCSCGVLGIDRTRGVEYGVEYGVGRD
jgi:hypothetical protein